MTLTSGKSAGIYPFEPTLQPESIAKFPLNMPQGGTNPVLHVKAVLFGDGEAAADGDAEAVEAMWFDRLGQVLEAASCHTTIMALDPTRLDDVSLKAVIDSLDDSVLPLRLESVLASFPDSALKTKVQGGDARAQGAFRAGVREWRTVCRSTLQRLLEYPNIPQGSVEVGRAKALLELQNRPQSTALLRAVEMDMGVAQ
jgi:hypothetical protein